MYKNLIFEQDGPAAIIRLHRPEKKNSLNAALKQELGELLGSLARNENVRAVIITGGEEIFCAGADIGEINQETRQDRSAEAGYNRSRSFHTLFDRIEALPQPVIAAVAGYALGGGCELALACDFRIASETAVFGLPEVKIGGFPAGGATQRLPRLIGAAQAKEMILTGEPIDARRAFSLGLVTKVTSRGTVLEEAKAYACRLAALPRFAVEAAKMLINLSADMDLASGLQLEARCMGSLGTSHDFMEGTIAFLEKRKPAFTGH